MTLQELRALRERGAFHHATYRCQGTLHEGLWIYEKYPQGGSFPYRPVGCFFKDDPNLDAAYELVRATGISVGAYGQG